MKKSSLLRTDKEITEIYRRNVKSVFGIAVLYMKNRADAEDIVQNVFCKFIDYAPVFKNENHEKGWFITVTKNMCRNSLKSPWRTRREETEAEKDASYIQTFHEEGEVVKAVKELPENHRLAIYLYYFEEQSVRDIAMSLGKKESTVRT